MSIPGITNVSCFFFCIFVVFGILGGTLFRGQANPYCTDHGVTLENCEGMYVNPNNGRTEPREWMESTASFDNIYFCMITLLEIATLEGWSGYMHFFLERPGGMAMEALFFILWVMIAAVFMLNLFIGIVFQEFQSAAEGPSGFSMLTDAQKDWVMTARNLFLLQPAAPEFVPENKYRRILVETLKDSRFENFIAGMIMANVVVLTLSHWAQPGYWAIFIQVCTFIFNVIFAAEAFSKMIGFGFSASRGHLHHRCLLPGSGGQRVLSEEQLAICAVSTCTPLREV